MATIGTVSLDSDIPLRLVQDARDLLAGRGVQDKSLLTAAVCADAGLLAANVDPETLLMYTRQILYKHGLHMRTAADEHRRKVLGGK